MKKVWKFWSSGFLILCLLLAMTACGKSTEDPGNADSGGKRKLIVGTDATYAPMEYMDKNGNIVGIDIDIVKAIAKEIGVELEIKNYGWDPLFPAVKNGEVDFAVSSITIRDDRQKTHDFTEPYFVANQVILVPGDSDIEKFEDLKGKKVSAQINTTGHFALQDLLGKTSPNILTPETMPLAISEMLNGNADAAVGDNVVVIEYQKNNPNIELHIIEDDSFEKEYYGLMVKKGNKELVNLLNEGIKKIKENGILKEITGFDIK